MEVHDVTPALRCPHCLSEHIEDYSFLKRKIMESGNCIDVASVNRFFAETKGLF